MAAPSGSPPATSVTSEPRWGLGDAVAGWALAYGSALVFSAIVVAAMGYEPGDELPLTVIAITYPPLWIGFIGVPVWAAATKGNGWIADFRVRFKLADLPIGVPSGFLTQILVVPLVSLPVLYLAGKDVDDLSQSARDLADKAVGLPGELLFLVIVGVLAPIAEEVFFRGLVFRAFEKRWGQWPALGLSSVVFGATHFQPLQFAALTAAGAVFGLLMILTGRLGTAIVAHMAFNITTVVVLLWV